MSRTSVATDGFWRWKDGLASSDKQWKRGFSAFEAAISWELADREASGLPASIFTILEAAFPSPQLLLAIAEHQVALPGHDAASQNDVWAIVKSGEELISLAVEAKCRESFGKHTLRQWFAEAKSDRSKENRNLRWDYLSRHLPLPITSYDDVAYQLLHRCACAVIEAERFAFKKAVMLVQSFDPSHKIFTDFQQFANAIGLAIQPGELQKTTVGSISLWIGWADCPKATSDEIAKACARKR